MKLEDCEGPWVFDGEVSQPNGDVRPPPLATHSQVKVQPHSVDFYSAVRDSQRDVKELLTESLSRFSTLTEAWPGSPVNGSMVQWDGGS